MICCFGSRSLKHSSRKSWIMALKMLANRCATFSKYGSPPECYTQVLSGPSPHAINAMKTDEDRLALLAKPGMQWCA